MDLSEDEAEASLEYLLHDANEASISAFLVLLRAKGETYEEVSPSFELLFEFVLVIVPKNELRRCESLHIRYTLCLCYLLFQRI